MQHLSHLESADRKRGAESLAELSDDAAGGFDRWLGPQAGASSGTRGSSAAPEVESTPLANRVDALPSPHAQPLPVVVGTGRPEQAELQAARVLNLGDRSPPPSAARRSEASPDGRDSPGEEPRAASPPSAVTMPVALCSVNAPAALDPPQRPSAMPSASGLGGKVPPAQAPPLCARANRTR